MSPACSTCPTPSRRCPRWCRSPTGRVCGSCWTGNRCWLREGEILVGTRKLDMRRGVLLSAWTHRTPAGITVDGRELRLLSLADRAVGLQLLRLSLDRDGVDVRLEASFAMAGLGMEPMRLEQDLGAWRTEGTGKGVAMAGAATLRLGGELLAPERPFSLRWVWRWRSVAGQVAEFDRLVAVARADTPEDDPAPRASAALARNRALGWRAVLAAHEAAWEARWTASDIVIEGDDELQRARALRRLPSDQRRQPRGRARLDRRARPHRRRLFRPRLLGHRDLPAALLHRGLAGGGAGAADVPLPHAARRAREGGAFRLQGRALRLGIGRHRRRRPRPSAWSGPTAS